MKDYRNVVASCDKIAEYVETNYKSLGLSRQAAFDLCMKLAMKADALEEVMDMADLELEIDEDLRRDMDENYMDTFHAPTRPHIRDMDEPYMDEFNDSPYDSVNDYVDLDRKLEGNPLAKHSSEDDWYTRAKKAFAPEDNWYTRGE